MYPLHHLLSTPKCGVLLYRLFSPFENCPYCLITVLIKVIICTNNQIDGFASDIGVSID